MKKYLLMIMGIALLAASCRKGEDTRFFAPEAEFGAESYSVASDGTGVDVVVVFSRPAPVPFSLSVNVGGPLVEGVQYSVVSKQVAVAEGDMQAVFHLDFVDDEIWDESSWVDVTLAPGTRYTVDPAGRSMTRVNVTKTLVLPVLSLEVVEGDLEMNPYCPETLRLRVVSTIAPKADLTVMLDAGEWAAGQDFLVNGSAAMTLTLPEGETSVELTLDVVKKDESGYDKQVTLAIEPERGVYGATSTPLTLHLSDPLVDFSPLWKTKAANNGTGYQIRQAIKKSDGSWDGNTTVDIGVSSDGSNYLRNYRNMYSHLSFNCMANASVSQLFRMNEFFPLYLYPNETAILDYGNDQNHREFSPSDSLMRFVLDKGETGKGRIYLNAGRTFKAYIGSYSAWQDRGTGELAWVVDSRATNGNIDASQHTALTGSISVTLVRLEGSFDFTNTSEPVLVTAWFRSDSDKFMAADVDHQKDPAGTLGLVQEDGLWKVEYKLWPR